MIFSLAAIVGCQWRTEKYRILVIQWQALQLDRWHHTAHIKALWAKKNTSYTHLHPYMSGGSTGTTGIPVDSSKRAIQIDEELIAKYERIYNGYGPQTS